MTRARCRELNWKKIHGPHPEFYPRQDPKKEEKMDDKCVDRIVVGDGRIFPAK